MKLSEKIQEALRQQQEINLSDPVVQKRLAAQLGCVPADAQPAPSFADAYQGAMEEVAIWKKRALEAEDLSRKFIAEINGPMHMGEPAQPEPSVPDSYLAGVKAVADMIQKKADDYANEHGYDDMGGLSFGGGMGGEIKMDYYNNLIELIEEVRAMPVPVLKSENASFIDTNQLEGVVSTEIVHSYPPPSGWLRAIDEALIGLHADMATDPAVNGGYKLVSVRLTPKTKGAGE